jgi:hypothetical protein
MTIKNYINYRKKKEKSNNQSNLVSEISQFANIPSAETNM